MTAATWRVICADVVKGLAELADESVQCIVTSPPYWGLRDYGVDGQIDPARERLGSSPFVRGGPSSGSR